MSVVSRQKTTRKQTAVVGKQRGYGEVIEFLNAHWIKTHTQKTFDAITRLDAILGKPAKRLKTILVGGTNGKGLTIHFAAKLLRAEGLRVGAFYSPHLLTYNERISWNLETISNKSFTEAGNEIISAAETNDIPLDSATLLTMMAIWHFDKSGVDVAVLEAAHGNQWDPTTVCDTKVVAITRITDDELVEEPAPKQIAALIKERLGIVSKGTWFVSADQSKFNLHSMHEIITATRGNWAMPIRKLAPLAYPFEQLHGRCAALAERASQLFVQAQTDTTVVTGSLLTKAKGQRGRPTLEAKRQQELNPKRTMDQYWREEISSLSGHFQVLDKEKPTLLLDTASNIDALKNILLGVRLLHYQRPLKGLTMIIGCHKNSMKTDAFLRSVRYFFKKTAGQIIVCPIEQPWPGHKDTASWDAEQVTNELRNLKIKAKPAANFQEAFEMAKQTVDERYGLVVITGSSDIVAQYWRYKGLKRL